MIAVPRSRPITAALEARAGCEIPYLYVSLIIELRAIWTYRLYQQVLEARPRAALSLKSVLAEETLHLQHMLGRLEELDSAPRNSVPAFARIEDRLFRHLWSELDAACEALPRAA